VPHAGIDVVLVAPEEPVPQPGQVVDGGGGVAGGHQQLGQERRLAGQRRSPTVGDDAVGQRVLTGVEGGERRLGRQPGAEEGVADGSLGGQRIETGAGRPLISVAAQMIRPQGINHDQNHVRQTGYRHHPSSCCTVPRAARVSSRAAAVAGPS